MTNQQMQLKIMRYLDSGKSQKSGKSQMPLDCFACPCSLDENKRKQNFIDSVTHIKENGFIQPQAEFVSDYNVLQHAYLTDSGRSYLKDNPTLFGLVRNAFTWVLSHAIVAAITASITAVVTFFMTLFLTQFLHIGF